ncbi:P-loop containing nucleoside triphosphate hydrolase [Sesbania bispinosa]|nr:P-loop containing nucleoside triphosphate hydrolase [Sesbania bispinosa]
MAGALVGGAFLSGFINVVFDRLSSPEVLSLIRSKKLDEGLLLRLKNTLYAVEAVLNDAELKQIKDSAVNKWLDDLKDAVYVADDILDHVSTKAATQREVSSNFFSRYFNFQDREMVHKLHDIVGRLESILNLKDILGLKEIPRDNFSWRIPSTSLADGSNIYGRDKDKESLLKLLLDDDTKNSDGKISVIPIVGMGGVGKTTLAQLAFNDDKVKQKFEFQAWACVSEEFDILKVTKMITVAVTKSSCNMNDINLLQLDLKEKVTEKKFLLVLDDVWSEDYDKWNFLIKPLQYGAKGSKIVVTTRSEKVARTVQTVQFFSLKMSDEDCWSVFASHACFSLESGDNRALEKIGRKIARKCKGLPLAAQSLGGLLRAKHDIRDWEGIKTLPESLCNLYNLQTLMLGDCTKLAMLPSGMQNLVNLRHLDISETNLGEMPRGMSKLNHLQHLSHFVVGKHEENGIKELGKLSNLHGSLEIKKLENVTSIIEVSEARMMDKKYLNELKFHWSEGDDFTNSQSEMEILDKLEPHKNLKSLEIQGYRGTKFPEWVGHPSFHNMTNLTLSKCNNCCMLPCLGQLPSLKRLVIWGLNGVEIITPDFSRRMILLFQGQPFPVLEDLQFRDMACWEVWCPFESDAFPKLKRLQIKDCPKLMGDLPTHLPALEVLGIHGCQQLASSSLPRAPSILELEIIECNKLAVQELPLSLRDLKIKGRHDMESIFKAITQSTTLQFLQIENCSSATSFPGNCLPTSLKELGIKNFRKLKFPKQNQHQLLELLNIWSSCDSLKSFPLESFPNLGDLIFCKCENLERLSVSESPLQNLRIFEVLNCPSFVSFPEGVCLRPA